MARGNPNGAGGKNDGYGCWGGGGEAKGGGEMQVEEIKL